MARDKIHYLVREALEKDNWFVTNDPLILRLGGLRMEVDLAAEQVFAAERGEERIAVEVKSFLSKSKLSDFYEAKGKYDLYRLGLIKENKQRQLYLAVELEVYSTFFQKPLIQEILEQDKISIIVIDSQSKSIVEWITR
jgi:XisH protein